MFLGLNELVVKSHVSAESLGFAAAIDIAYEFAQEEVGIKITKNVKSSIARSVDNYAFLSFEFLKLQKMLEQTGRYLLSNEKDALTQVYLNEEVFSKYYLEGLLLSEALWPNHYLINRFFHKSFIQIQ